MKERRFVKGAEVRAKKGEKPAIEGYGAVFNQEYVLYEDSSWRLVETIKPGAFARVLKEKQDTRCLFNHEPDNVLGRTTNQTLRMTEDDSGLHFDNDLDVRTTVGQNVRAFVDRGDVTGCSFAFTVSKQSWREEKSSDGKSTTSFREIEEIENLYDVGPVTYPAYEGTSVAARSAHELRSLADSIEGLPAEVRSHIARASKDAECNCRCVACAKEKNCDSCADHMVDCGDEANCACKDVRSGKRGQVGANITCQCTCPECQVGDCEHCSNSDCTDEGCGHTDASEPEESYSADRDAEELNARMRSLGVSPL